jgi:hypothetical protein
MFSEGILDVDDPGHPFADEYADHVEAYGIEVRLPLGEVPFGQRADGSLFAGRDGLEWMPEANSPTQFHFDEDERLSSEVQTLTTPELVFRALLTQDGAQLLELARA